MSKLSATQLDALVDIHYQRERRFRTATIKSLEKRGLIERYDDGCELTPKGMAIIEQADIDTDTNDLIDASFYLGKTAVDKPGLIAIAVTGMVLGGLVKKWSE